MNYKKSRARFVYLIISAGIINLLMLYFIKYASNDLSLTDFNLFNTGNFVNLILTLLLITGSILLLNTKSNIHIGNLQTLVFISIIYLIPIVVLIILNFIDMEFKTDYFIGYPLKKIVPVLFYILNQTVFLFVIFVLFYLAAFNSLLSYLYSVLSVAATIAFILIISVIFTFFTAEYNPNVPDEKYDYGIVLGAAVWSKNRPSPMFTGRIDRSAELYLNGKIGKIQLTGGNAPGEVSEAMAAKNYLEQKYNIDPSDIYIEEYTSTTNEQIRFVKHNYFNSGKLASVIIISDDFHLKRIEEMMNFYNINAKVVSSEYKLNFQKSLYYRIRDSIGLILFWFFAI